MLCWHRWPGKKKAYAGVFWGRKQRLSEAAAIITGSLRGLTGEIGFELSPAAMGQGYMREALELMLEFGFGSMGLNRIEALCHPDNIRAEQLITRLGFRQEGLLRQYRHTASGYQDVRMYSLLQGEKVRG